MRKAETPASDSQSAKTKKGQEMQQQSSSRHVDLDSDYYPSDEELASVAGKQFVALDNPYGDVGYGPIRGIPASFCRDHLPNHDDTIVLEDKEGKTYETNYIAYKMGLSGGWKGFVKQQHLKVDDAVVFQLVRQRTFKVYILRENEFTATDGALGLLSLDTSMCNKKEKESSNEHAKSKEAVDGGVRFPCSDFDDFAAVKSFVDFKIVIGNGLLVLPDHLRMTINGPALKKAVELEKKLPGPSFIKGMMHSQVVKGFWLVYILRENEFTATDGALGLLSLDTSMGNKKEKESSNEHAKSKEAVDGGVRFPCSDFDDFAAVKSFVDFKIVIGNGLLVLPDHLRMTYYHLCQARKAFLHRNLLKTISPEFTTRMIVEMANIAEGIRASSPASLEDLAEWKKILESFEAKGMDVALMSKRVDDLLGLLGAPSQISVVPEGYEAVRLERARAAKELRAIESRLSTLKDSLKVMDVNMEEMVEASTRMKEQAMRKLATAPW
ncbi:hypothetical protein ACQ4PT_068181 [Festuca glaucescens]